LSLLCSALNITLYVPSRLGFFYLFSFDDFIARGRYVSLTSFGSFGSYSLASFDLSIISMFLSISSSSSMAITRGIDEPLSFFFLMFALPPSLSWFFYITFFSA
jgi:hypothetical protein